MNDKQLIPIHPLSDWLADGSEVRRCPLDLTDGKILYCTRDARFFSHLWLLNPDSGRFEWCYHEIQPNYTPNSPSKNSGGWSNYMFMRQYGDEYCHTLVLSTWDKPRPGPDYEGDHLDGNTLNNHIDNLEWVTKAENRKRARLLRVLRSIGRDPRKMSRKELLEIFNKYEFTDPQNLD